MERCIIDITNAKTYNFWLKSPSKMASGGGSGRWSARRGSGYSGTRPRPSARYTSYTHTRVTRLSSWSQHIIIIIRTHTPIVEYGVLTPLRDHRQKHRRRRQRWRRQRWRRRRGGYIVILCATVPEKFPQVVNYNNLHTATVALVTGRGGKWC